MTKKSRPTKHYPGELQRLTVLIQGKAREIAEVLMSEFPDAEQAAEDRKGGARTARRSRAAGRTGKRKPNRKRDLVREAAISAWRHKAFRH